METRIMGEHFEYLKQLMEKGMFILAGRTLNTDHSSFGLGIFKAASEQEARQVVEDDPAVKNKVMRAELYPYRIALLKAENV